MKEIIIIVAFIGVLIGLFLILGGGLSKSSNILLVPTLKGDTGAQGPAGASGANADFSNIAKVNQSNAFIANNTFQDIFSKGYLNESNSTTLGNTSIEKLSSNLIPFTDLAWNLGSSTLRWSDSYSSNFWGSSFNGTWINATYVNSTNDVNTSRLFVGNNRSAFPISCTGTNKISSLDANGFLTCTADQTGSTDYSNIAYQNQSNTFTNINNFKSMSDFDGIVNVSNSTTLGNTSISNLNASILYVGLNRSAFPITCTGTNKLSSLSAEGFWTCGADLNNQTDYTNICYLNQTQTFTGVNTLSNNWNFKGFLNNSNSTTLGNTTIQGDFNVSNLTVLGTTFINNYPAVSMIFDNETEDSLVANKSFKSFTLPANNFSRVIIEADYEIDGATGSLYSWILEFRNSTAIWKDVNFTDSSITGLQQRFGGIYSASAVQKLSSVLNVTFFPITAGSAIVGINSLRIYGVS